MTTRGWSVALIVLVGLVADGGRAATFTLINADPPGVGFNDPTPAVPSGGNPGVTRGEQRLIVVQYAAEIWAEALDSSVDIRVVAQTAAGCLFGGFAQVGAMVRDFANAPLSSTWYPVALANKLAGTDLCPPGMCGTSDDMTIILGRDCGLYLGLDNNPPFGGPDFARIAIHEFGHGLGFTTPMNPATGQRLMNLDDVYIRNLEDHSTGKTYPEMSDAERVAASTNTGNLHWIGPSVVAASSVLLSGVDVNGHVDMYAPPTFQFGSTVYHFSTTLFPDQVLEPSSGSVADHDIGLAREVMRDIGWFLETEDACPPAPAANCEEGFARVRLLIDERIAGRERLIVKLADGPSLTQADFGDPVPVGGTGYDFCIYDDAGALAGALAVDRAGDTTCRGAPCWRPIGRPMPAGKGYRYVDADATRDGVRHLLLKGGSSSRVVLRAKGPVPPLPGGIAGALLVTSSATVQLHRKASPNCVSATLAEIIKQGSHRFQAK